MAKSRKAPPGRAQHGRPGRFRIIGGEWRSRRLVLPPVPGVRPTPDRVRETVFNWLAPLVAGARCLDLFAGSGALGLEALSRGAARAMFVDRDPAVLRQLRENLGLLGCEHAELVALDAMSFLETPAQPMDLVFVDPPYGQGLLSPALERLAAGGWLAPAAAVYIEHEAALPPPSPPAGWRLVRSAAAGQVRYHLLRKEPQSLEQA